MDTKDLALFLAITRTKSISRTAEQLYMSQSTVTTRIQRLERTLGYTLFFRTPNGVLLTPEGERLVGLAERIGELEQQMTNIANEQMPVLRIISGRAFVSTDVPECLKRMLRQTKVHLQVRMGLYDEMVDALLANQVDFCFLGEPIYHPNIRQLEMEPDAVDLVVPADHYFTHAFPGVRSLANEPFIAFGREDAPYRQRVMKILAKENIFPPILMEMDSIDGVKAMVSHGFGVSLLPRRTLHDATGKNYAVVPLQDKNWSRPTYLCYPESIREKPLTRQFITLAKAYYQELAQNP